MSSGVAVVAPVSIGDIVKVRSRQYLVQEVVLPPREGDSTLVRLSCLEDDAIGEPLEVLWERELDARKLTGSGWEAVASRGFDDPTMFSAYMHTLRWNCVTATDPKLFQSPYRAGIEVKAYQLEPLRKALLLPRVNLFIADDVGLGKTIEAGLILRELIMRQKVRRTVICCPPSVVRQWQEEMEQRFGLTFVIYDREFVAQKRRERGYSVNPWRTHNRFIISHALIRDENYTASLRDWLGDFAGGSMLILDEAHNVAPASSSRYAIDSRLTRTIRDIAPRFEHRLFLSATPHNGHSNSFAALLEILDPQRFCRGVPIKNPKLLEAVMVRRLKKDLRGHDDDFPDRKVLRIEIDGLPHDAPELLLSRLLQQYRQAKEQRMDGEPVSRRNAAMLVVTSLQKRLLSSIEAFYRTLKVHCRTMSERPQAARTRSVQLLIEPPDADDERADLPEEDVQAEEEAQMAAATEHTGGSNAEMDLVRRMLQIAEDARYDPDSRMSWLEAWVKKNLCPDLGQPGAKWLDRRVLIFTDYADTKRYLVERLQALVRGSERAAERIDTFHGGVVEEKREEIKRAFNADPAHHPLRILVATDAAREGVNLQNHCADLFHFDVPWNPSKMEQRNGRIDRKLQREREVRCHYFVVKQRAEDRVLDILVSKTVTIRQELGSLPPVVEKRVFHLLKEGIRADAEARLKHDLAAVDAESAGAETGIRVVQEELEEVREREKSLAGQLATLRAQLDESRKWIGLDERHFRDAITASLTMLGTPGLREMASPRKDGSSGVPGSRDTATQATQKEGSVPGAGHAGPRRADTERWEIPSLHERLGADPTWQVTLDALRAPQKRGQKLWEWRRDAPIRPVVFHDPGTLDGEVVHLHLEHRVVRRLLGRFISQGFLHHELSRACIVLTEDAQPHVVLLGRLSLYGPQAARLHEEIVTVAAPWTDPDLRGRGRLKIVGEGEKDDVLHRLGDALATPRLRDIPHAVREQCRAHTPRDVDELLGSLEKRAETLAERAERKLADRGQKEAKEMRSILEGVYKRIDGHLDRFLQGEFEFMKDFNREEHRQIEADKRHWEKRLEQLKTELDSEPRRIERLYDVKARRVEPVGLVYLWPISG